MKVLMVITSHERLGETHYKTGFWLEEFASSQAAAEAIVGLLKKTNP